MIIPTIDQADKKAKYPVIAITENCDFIVLTSPTGESENYKTYDEALIFLKAFNHALFKNN